MAGNQILCLVKKTNIVIHLCMSVCVCVFVSAVILNKTSYVWIWDFMRVVIFLFYFSVFSWCSMKQHLFFNCKKTSLVL